MSKYSKHHFAEPSTLSSPFVRALFDAGIATPGTTKVTIVVEVNNPIRIYTEGYLDPDKSGKPQVIVQTSELAKRLTESLLP